MIGIYKITNKINGKFYIGQSVDVKRRFMEHKTPHGTMTSIKLAIKKYGKENFLFEVIEECNVNELDNREIFWIKTLKPEYNRCSGGTGSKGHYVSEELKKLLSEKNKAYWNNLPQSKEDKIIKNLVGREKGHEVTKETREKLRKANLGKKQSAETIKKRKETILRKKENGYVQTNKGHCKKVRCVETNEIFNSIKEAGEHFGANTSGITSVLKGRQKTCKNHTFEYVM